MRTKVCTKCGEDKRLSEYPKHPRGKFGRYPRCFICHRTANRVIADRNRTALSRPEPEQRKCSHCKEVLPAERFTKCRSDKSGLYTYCKACVYAIKSARYQFGQKQYQEQWRQANKDKVAQYQRDYRARRAAKKAQALQEQIAQ